MWKTHLIVFSKRNQAKFLTRIETFGPSPHIRSFYFFVLQTFIGSVLVAVNPYQDFPIYSAEQVGFCLLSPSITTDSRLHQSLPGVNILPFCRSVYITAGSSASSPRTSLPSLSPATSTWSATSETSAASSGQRLPRVALGYAALACIPLLPVYPCSLLFSQRGIRSREDGEHKTDPAVLGSGQRATLPATDRKSDPAVQPDSGRYTSSTFRVFSQLIVR